MSRQTNNVPLNEYSILHKDNVIHYRGGIHDGYKQGYGIEYHANGNPIYSLNT
jgi:hypothetical protein